MTTLKVDSEGRIKLPRKLLKALGPDGRIELRDSSPGHIELVVPARVTKRVGPLANAAAKPAPARMSAEEARRQVEEFMESMRALHPKDMPQFPGETLQEAIDQACRERAEQIVRNGRG